MTEPRKRPIWPIVVGGLVFLPVPYVLGVGPAAWAWSRRIISRDTYSAYYAPIVKVADFCGLYDWLYWYKSFWVDYDHPGGNIRPIVYGAFAFVVFVYALGIKLVLPTISIATMTDEPKPANWPALFFWVLLAFAIIVFLSLPAVQ